MVAVHSNGAAVSQVPRSATSASPTSPVPSSRSGTRPSDTPFELREFEGRIVEFSGLGASAVLTMAFELVLDAQLLQEPVAWVTRADRSFFPPDVVSIGVDLSALTVVRVKEERAMAMACDLLLRSGAFGLVVLDLGRLTLKAAIQTRLLGLARKHRSTLLCLTEKSSEHPSLGSLVSVRAHAERTRIEPSKFQCGIVILKDKRNGPTWSYKEVHCGPPGVR